MNGDGGRGRGGDTGLQRLRNEWRRRERQPVREAWTSFLTDLTILIDKGEGNFARSFEAHKGGPRDH